MATMPKPADTAKHATPSKEVSSTIFFPKDTLHQPCDVVLVVEDGKEFRAHRQVLSEASPFFQKLLNSDMKESKEGIVRLEMFSESVMGNTLEFIYAGNVQILTEDSAWELIIMADYLFLQNLKTLAEGVLLQKLEISNCISTYYLSDRYQCTELFSKTTEFIHENFSDVCDIFKVLNMTSKQIQMWISTDEINVNTEEDVFKIILAWIDHDKDNRKKYFAELFRQVRLVYVSRDFLCNDISTNDLVNDNEDSLALVEEAMRLFESRNYDNLPVTPRKCLEVPVIVASSLLMGQPIRCYFPREDRWYTLGEMPLSFKVSNLVSCRGKIYGIQTRYKRNHRMVSFNPYTNNWMRLPYKEQRDLKQIFAANEDEMYALVTGRACKCRGLRSVETEIELCGKEKHVSFIIKYKPESNSWEDISSFDHLNLRQDVCIVAKGNFIYFIGGKEWLDPGYKFHTDVDRYDLRKNQWDKVAGIQIARSCATGAVAHGKIFIAGGTNLNGNRPELFHCEMFIETTNEWQFTTIIGVHLRSKPKLLSVDDRLYVLAKMASISGMEPVRRKVDCYDPEEDEWDQKTEIPLVLMDHFLNYCSIKIFKGFLNNEPEKEDTQELTSPFAQSSHDLSSSPLQDNRKHASLKKIRQQNCFIL
ncbi:kelch-like protein 40 [Oculina patagonica]